MADGSVVITADVETAKAEKQLKKLEREIDRLKQQINKKEGEQNALKQQFEEATNKAEETRRKVEALKKEYESIQGTLKPGADMVSPDKYIAALEQEQRVTAELAEQEALLQQQDATAAKLGEQYAKAYDATAQAKADLQEAQAAAEGYATQLAGAESAASGAADATGETAEAAEEAAEAEEKLGDKGADAGNRIADAMENAQKRMQKFEKRIIGLAKRVFVFSLITKALRGMRDYIWETVQADEQAGAALAKLRASVLTLVQPIMDRLIPAITWAIQLLNQLAATAARITSKLFGTNVFAAAAKAENNTKQNAKDSSKALKKEAQAVKGVGKAFKEASKSIASFDELNILAGDSANDAGEAMDDLGDLVGADEMEPNKYDFSSVVSDALDSVAELFVGLGLVALGAILTFSGINIPLGLGMIVIGALMVWDAVSEDWDAIKKKLQGPMGILLGVISAAFLVIGAILTFSGANIPLGIALMVMGAATLATVVALNWDSIKNKLQGPIGAVVAVVSGALLALGAILAFSGVNLPLGIALMAAGAVGIVAVEAANWDAIKTKMKGPIGKITALVSGALLALGAILAFSGVAMPLGIALMAAGAVGLSTALAANWDTVKQKLQGPIGQVVALVSGALIVLGAILLFSGAGIPLGLGLIVAGAAGLAMTIAANWNTVKQKMQGPIGDVVMLISGALIVLGVILLFTGAGIPLGLGLVAAGAAGLATTIAANWNWLPKKIQEVWNNILKGIQTAWSKIKTTLATFWQSIKQGAKTAWDGIWNTIKSVINRIISGIEAFINRAINGINFLLSGINKVASAVGSKLGFGRVSLSIPRISIPRLAQGAVIPPNKEFLAVLGDQGSGNNIEAPEALLRQMAAEAASPSVELLREILRAVQAGQVMELDGQRFGKVVHQAYNKESSRIGGSLIEVTL